MNLATVEGKLLMVDSDSITVQQPSGPQTVPLADVFRVRCTGSRGRNAALGALIGAAGGAVIFVGIENKMDTSGEVPKLHHLLGVVLMRKRDYPAAADELRAYLGTLRDGPEAEFVRRQLDACETRQAGRSPAQQPFMP